jgi:hypothetical protein
MRLHTEGKIPETEDIEIQRAIFQGELVTTAIFNQLNPFTEQLNKLDTEYKEHTTKTKVSHLLYMVDLKLIGKTEEEL